MMFLQRQNFLGGVQGASGGGILPFFPPQLVNNNLSADEVESDDDADFVEDLDEIESLADFPLDHQ